MKQNHPRSLRWFFVIIIVLVAAMAFFCSCSCSKGDYSGRAEIIHVGVPPLEQNALLYVADHEKFFLKKGLRVVIRDYDTGVTAIRGMSNGEVDIAEAAEFPFVRAVLQKEEIRVIACNDIFENDYIVGRKDRGITKIADLKGKRIGVALKTINEFYLGRFLALNGMDIRDVALIDLTPAQYVKAILEGEVDAIIAWQPYIRRIEKAVKGLMVWPAQSSQAAYGILVCNRQWLAQHGSVVKSFLKSLAQAESYLLHHPDKAKTIVQRRLNYDDSYVALVWPQHHFSLSLTRSLILAMKDEAQWMITSNLTGEKALPVFVNYICTEALKEINPKAVDIID